MTPPAKRELLIIIIAIIPLAIITIYSISYARQAVRDDLRKQDITNIKRALEQYYNAHDSYVLPPSKEPECTTNAKESWFFGDKSPLLQEQFIDAIPHDVRESRGFTYTYCVTSVSNNRATGFYLQASLEGEEPEGVFFDEDEKRKFNYLVLLEQEKRLYRVCGGEELQCQKP